MQGGTSTCCSRKKTVTGGKNGVAGDAITARKWRHGRKTLITAKKRGCDDDDDDRSREKQGWWWLTRVKPRERSEALSTLEMRTSALRRERARWSEGGDDLSKMKVPVKTDQRKGRDGGFSLRKKKKLGRGGISQRREMFSLKKGDGHTSMEKGRECLLKLAK